jgi:hypothetical protein
VRVCERVSVRESVRVCVCERERESVCVCVRAFFFLLFPLVSAVSDVGSLICL